MQAYRIAIEGKAKREFAKLDAAVRGRFYAVFEQLELDPLRPRPACDIRVLAGMAGVRAIRVGEFRGIYEVHGNVVNFTSFGHRRAVYR